VGRKVKGVAWIAIILNVTAYIPDKLSQELRPDFVCSIPGFQCRENAAKSRKRIENKRE
jgi:hypothetical protein